MAITKQPSARQKSIRRIWKTPGSKFNWLFLAGSLFILGWVFFAYRSALATQDYPSPFRDPFRAFGIVAFVLVLLVTAYTLRRRFIRNLPGKVHTWLWLHIWLGVVSLFIVSMHENFQGITHSFIFLIDRFTEAAYGTTALYALFLLVVTGIIGRLLDIWQARTIAAEADTNGVGIIRSLEDRLLELSLTIERLSAGKSNQFKQYVEQMLDGKTISRKSFPLLSSGEGNDFKRAGVILKEYTRLRRSLQRQRRATRVIRGWRYVHIPLAILAVAVISFHSLVELWNMLILHQ